MSEVGVISKDLSKRRVDIAAGNIGMVFYKDKQGKVEESQGLRHRLDEPRITRSLYVPDVFYNKAVRTAHDVLKEA